MVTIDGKLVNKANHYEIRIHPNLWKRIRPLVEQWRSENISSRPWWIGPSGDTLSFQEMVAWQVKIQSPQKFGTEPVRVTILLINQSTDVDAVKSVLDGIQDSGVIANDRQIRELRILHQQRSGEKAAIKMSIEAVTG